MSWLGPAFFAASLLALACDSRSSAPPPARSAPPAASPNRPPSSKVPPSLIETPSGCRALVVKGGVRAGSSPVAAQARLEQAGFIDLDAGAKLVAKHTKSGREMTLEGPARAQLCKEGEERILLASGRFKSSSGAGARPGAEVWVATAAGLVRYGDADLSVKVEDKKVTLSVASGEAWVVAARGSTLKGAEHVAPNTTASLWRGADSTPPSLVSDCEKSAQAAARAAEAVLSRSGQDGGDAGSLGERAAAQVQARRAARAACASAGAALGLVADRDQQDRLTARIESADRLWRLVPPGK